MFPAHFDGDDSTLAQPRDPRRSILDRAFRYYHFRDRIAYSQARPTQIVLPRNTTQLDCSGLVAACMDYAGVLPNVNWRYTNTWIQDDLGERVTVEEALPGDVVFYGPKIGNPTHEALYLGFAGNVKSIVGDLPAEVAVAMKGERRMVLSNGHHPMGIYPLDYRSDRLEIRRFV